MDVDHYEPHTTESAPRTPIYPLWNSNTEPVPKEQLLRNYTAIQQNIDSIIGNALSVESDAQVYGAR